MKCILCESTSQFLDDYKLNIESDIDYFGKLKIFYCESCDLGFANPMPDSEKLNYFYSNIYRAKGRPHEIPENYRFNLYSERNLSYFTYLSTFVNFENINNIFDYGSGLGDLGSLIKKKYDHINLSSIELEKTSKKILKSPGMMKKHYSPGIPVLINQIKHDKKSAFIYIGKKYKKRKDFFTLSKNSNLKEAASNLYKTFRMVKKKGYKKIQICKIPLKGSGIAINDRIMRASN